MEISGDTARVLGAMAIAAIAGGGAGLGGANYSDNINRAAVEERIRTLEMKAVEMRAEVRLLRRELQISQSGIVTFGEASSSYGLITENPAEVVTLPDLELMDLSEPETNSTPE